MTCRVLGRYSWEGEEDEGGNRTYHIGYRVESDTFRDGPANVMQTPGLAVPGAIWQIDDDVDVWAWCRPDMSVKQYQQREGERHVHWLVVQRFSTKAPDFSNMRCQDTRIEDPLLEPQKVRGSFTRYNEEATKDRFGSAIINSAYEQIRGPQVEFDGNRPSIIIEQNVANLELDLFSSMVDTVNAYPLWGFPPRCIKLSQAPWERKFYGSCSIYYTRTFTFDINAKVDPDTGIVISGFDRDILDEGTKCIQGHWGDPRRGERPRWIHDKVRNDGIQPDPDSSNPSHFMRSVDRKGNPMKVILDGHGSPIAGDIRVGYTGTGTGTGTAPYNEAPGRIHVEYYGESDFLLLGIPTVF